jgi:hypothetical protein
MVTIFEIKKYEVSYFAGAQNVGGYPYRAIIALRDHTDVFVAIAYFHHSTATMPPADVQKATGLISCHYSGADFPQVLDLLRNEKPVYVEFDARTTVANVRTSPEPVGEGELG